MIGKFHQNDSGGGNPPLKKRISVLAAALVLTGVLSGCGSLNLVFNPQDLYTLPELPAKYTDLNAQINAILEDGAEYAAPTAGANIQPVQLTDLDGDGQQEAVAFFRKPEDEKPLKICIFSFQGGSYRQTAVIEGSGSSVYSVVNTDLDGDGRTELLVGWRINAELQALSVYTLSLSGAAELLHSVSYVRYANADLDQDGRQELIVLHADEEGEGVADYYNWHSEGLFLQSTARVSCTMAELSQQGRPTLGVLRDGEPALFLTGVTEQAGAVTDILAVRNGELGNVVLSEATGVSSELAPFCGLYPADINGDGVTELPVPTQSGTESLSQQVDWRAFSLEGGGETVCSTYHCMEDGWYLHLPAGWPGHMQAERVSASGEASVTFYRQEANGSRGAALLRITAVTGSGREVRATRGSRVPLSRQRTTIYTAELPENGDGTLTIESVRTAFSLIAQDWIAAYN